MKFVCRFRLHAKFWTGLSLIVLMLAHAPSAYAEEAPSGTIMMKPLGHEAASGYFIVEGNPGDRKRVTVNLTNVSDQASAAAEFMVSDAPNAQGGGIGAIDPDSFGSRKSVPGFKSTSNRSG